MEQALDPVVVVKPLGASRPLLVEVPHAGTGVPAEIRGEILLDAAGIGRDADLHVEALYRRATELGCTLVYTRVSRFVVDQNRAADDVDALAVEGHPSPRPDSPRGLIWRVATDGTPALAAPLPYASYRRRIGRFHTPYHAAIDAEVARLRARFGAVVVLSGHSMPSVGKATHADPGKRRADVVPGDRKGASCAPEITRLAIEHFGAAGLSVAPNDPYQGGETTRRLGRPAEGLHALQVELNRDLYMDERTLARRADGFERLERLCAGLLERLAALAEEIAAR